MDSNAIARKMQWGKDGVAPIDSLKLNLVLTDLTQLAREKPFIAELNNSAGDTLALGLGRDESVLSWVAADGDPPYHASVGDDSADGTVDFYYRDTWSEFPRWSAVSIETALEAVRQFFETAQLPDRVRWKEV
jgi:hypothetical protein